LQILSTPIQQQYIYLPALASLPLLETAAKLPSLSQRLAATLLGSAIILFTSWLLGTTSLFCSNSAQLQSCTRNSAEEINSLLQPVFQVPRGTSLVTDLPDNTYCSNSIDILLFDTPRQPLPTPLFSPPVLVLLQYDQPEIVYLCYQEEKACYLAAYIYLYPTNYRKYRK
jgi:hypothetical protein